jgi:hypothetical protein
LPGGLAVLVDSADEIAGRLTENGVDIAKGLAHGAEAAVRCGAIMGSEQVASLEAAFGSGVLDPAALNLVGRLGMALAETAAAKPEPVGTLGATDPRRGLIDRSCRQDSHDRERPRSVV